MRDRLSRVVTVLGILVVVLLLAGDGVRTPEEAQAQAPRTIPKSFGTLKGAMNGRLIFEDSTGTIRIVDTADVRPDDTKVFRRN
jgi:hypothetical protein